MIASGTTLREYETEFDLALHEPRMIGVNDFYGRPLLSGNRVPPGMLLEAIHPEDVQSMLDHIEHMANLQLGESHQYNLRMKHLDGRWILTEFTSTAIEMNQEGRARKLRSQVRWIAEEQPTALPKNGIVSVAAAEDPSEAQASR